MVKRSIVLPPEYQPKLQKDKCSWKLPSSFPENDALAVLGTLQDHLSKGHVMECNIDVGRVEWTDPQSLLCLGLVLAESSLERGEIILDLGSTQENTSSSEHRRFLYLFANEGFLDAFEKHVTFRCDGKIWKDVRALFLHLTSVPQLTGFLYTNCIRPRIIRADLFEKKSDALHEVIEGLLKEAKVLSSETALGSDAVARDMLFQKMRKILYELVLNVAEHSHAEGKQSFAGIYARIRSPKPVEVNQKPWSDFFKETILTFGQQDFAPNTHAEWLELFICDVGEGLTSRIKEWHLPEKHEARKDLEKAKDVKKNPFHSIMLRLFRTEFSRYPRNEGERSAVTGLQHLGHLLTIGNDYCRIYTQKGFWVGGRHRWAEHYIPSWKDISNTKLLANVEYKGFTPVSGTAYAFSIQPDHSSLSDTNAEVATPDENARQEIVQRLKTQTPVDPAVSIYYDRSDDPMCLLPKTEELASSSPKVVVLRPPKNLSKQALHDWISLVAEHSLPSHRTPVTTLVIAGLTPFEALSIHQLLVPGYVSTPAKFDVYLVTENWDVACATTDSDVFKFKSDKVKAEGFFKPTDDVAFYAPDLAVLLRQMDSEVFWDGAIKMDLSPFFDNPVDWPASGNEESVIRLQRYIDLPLALTDPKCYRACLRALTQCLALYPEHNAIPADDLIDSLVKDAKLKHYPRKDKEEFEIIIGSIAVTAGTVNSLKKADRDESIHLMIHEDAGIEQGQSLAALLWIPKPPRQSPKEEDHGIRPWRRITNTSHIAPLGEKSISILRYERNLDGTLNFDKPLCCERTPKQMYDDFQRLNILKTGHWMYMNRHDLLTVNLRLAFLYSFLELGPLYFWLKDQFKHFFAQREGGRRPLAQLLVYPSHYVTDTILNHIRLDGAFSDIRPEGGMIPIKFLSHSTVSPLLASHLVKHRVENLIEKHAWETWEAVFFDDGTISGKHLRETGQLIDSLGAKEHYTIALLDRSGLPVQENVVQQFKERHNRFWRWDVPALGNKRNCPLCQALAIAQTHAQKLSSGRQKERLDKWLETWKVRNVDLKWYKQSLPQSPLMPPLEIGFGVYKDKCGAQQKERIILGSSTAATSLLMELTCLTTRADVTMKKAEEVASRHPDAAIEMVACQLLLFLDELSPEEKLERFSKLLQLIWKRNDETEAMSLAGLCFTLVDTDILEELWKKCRDELLSKESLGNYDAIIATNILRLNYRSETRQEYDLSKDASEVERCNYIMLGVGRDLKDLKEAITSFLNNLYRHPSNETQLSAHSTAIKTRLADLTEKKLDDATIRDNVKKVVKDMELVELILGDLQSNFNSQIPNEELDELKGHISELRALGSAGAIAELVKIGVSLQVLLYGNQTQEGLVTKVGKEMFREFRTSNEFDNNFIAQMRRSTCNEWSETVKAKEVDGRNATAAKRWRKSNGDIIQPIICCSANNSLEGIWVYCDSSIRGILKDTLLNVFYAREPIEDPFNNINGENALRADLWWRIHKERDFAVITVANATTSNRRIVLRPTTNIAGLERVGGSIVPDVGEEEKGSYRAHIKVTIPLHSYF